MPLDRDAEPATPIRNPGHRGPYPRSLVPHDVFSPRLADQQIELANDPLRLRLAEARRRQADDLYRPSYHFVSPESRLNDPNGLCYWRGNWHLFYQGYPPEDPRQHWGHAVSTDLIHWEDLPYAIYPGPERAVFSGSTLVEEHRVIAMYHGADVGNMVAVSDDPLLLNWEKVADGPVIPVPDEAGGPAGYNVFDPCVWVKDGVYYSLSAGKVPAGPGGRDVASGSLFRSHDLLTWEYLHEFVEGDRFTLINDDYACPYFLPIGTRHILLFYSHATGGQYLLGDYDRARDKFLATDAGRFNFGSSTPSGVHAPSATSYGPDAVVAIFNMNAGKPTGEWDQVMTLPRILRLGPTGEIRQEPGGDTDSLRQAPVRLERVPLPANKELVLPAIEGTAVEIAMTITTDDAAMVEIKVLRSPGGEEATSIIFMRERGSGPGRDYRPGDSGHRTGGRDRDSVIILETAHASLHADVQPRPPETAGFPLSAGENLDLRIFVDRSIVEVFVNGVQAVAARVYPSRADAIGVSVLSRGRASELVAVTAWPMRTAY